MKKLKELLSSCCLTIRNYPLAKWLLEKLEEAEIMLGRKEQERRLNNVKPMDATMLMNETITGDDWSYPTTWALSSLYGILFFIFGHQRLVLCIVETLLCIDRKVQVSGGLGVCLLPQSPSCESLLCLRFAIFLYGISHLMFCRRQVVVRDLQTRYLVQVVVVMRLTPSPVPDITYDRTTWLTKPIRHHPWWGRRLDMIRKERNGR